MERESQITDSACLALLEQEVNEPVVLESCLESFRSAQGVQQIIVYIVCLEVLQRLAVHQDGVFLFGIPEIGHLRGYEVAAAGMSAQCLSGSRLTLALKIYRCCIKIVHSMLQSIVDKRVYALLIDDVISVLVFCHRPPHAAVSQ